MKQPSRSSEHRLHVYIGRALREALQAYCKATGLSQSAVIGQALQDYLAARGFGDIYARRKGAWRSWRDSDLP